MARTYRDTHYLRYGKPSDSAHQRALEARRARRRARQALARGDEPEAAARDPFLAGDPVVYLPCGASDGRERTRRTCCTAWSAGE